MFEIWAVDTFYSEGWLKYSDGFAVIPGAHAFELYDTYGFPLDMTELLARERGLTVDTEGFERCMEEQRARGRASQQTTKITVTEGASQAARTQFAGYTPENLTHFNATVQDIVTQDEVNFVILDETPFYAEMGGQVGDIGVLEVDGVVLPIVDTLKDTAGRYLHKLGEPLPDQLRPDVPAVVTVDTARRTAIQRHHSATHVLNWALREVLGDHVLQRGSYVGPDRLRFDFSHFEAVTAEQLETIERMCNERILENGYVQTFEVPFAEKPPEVIATFGEKYGDVVRVVDIGGFSKELCGGTHVRTAAECGLFKIVSEASISAGVRRIEAVTGEAAYALTKENYERLHRLAGTLKCKPDEIEMRMEKLGEQTKALEKELKALRQQQAAAQAESLLAAAEARDGIKVLAAKVVVAEPGDLKTLANDLCNKLGPSAVALGAIFMDDKVSLCAQCTTEAVTAGYKAGDLVKRMAPIVGGKGGGKPNFAMGGGTEPAKLAAALEAAFSG
ncbi:MAG: alanine--tRNA ligase-related protein [Opitutales bacterium]